MFQYEYEKRPPSANSCDSRSTMTTDWSRVYPSRAPSAARVCPSVERARRPLPPRPVMCDTIPTKTTVPLKVWIIASASCFAVCAALVLATVVITKWGTSETYTTRELFVQPPEPIYTSHQQLKPKTTTEEITSTENITPSLEDLDEIEMPILEKLSIFRNIVASRDKKKQEKPEQTLISKPQLHPIHDTSLHHDERKIEKKDKAKLPTDVKQSKRPIPQFKPTLPDVYLNKEIKLVDGFIPDFQKHVDYEEYYNDENLYDDYMQSNSMTSYLIEKVQELHDWITTDSDFEVSNETKKSNSGNEFGQLLKALNESLIEGNVTIIMNKLKDIYFGDNYTHSNHSRKVILSNSTDLLSFGILTLDIMLLHNIQLMAWESQETSRNKMLKDPDVFAFNALFLEPNKVEAKQNEVYHHYDNAVFAKRQNLRQDMNDMDIGKNLLENALEIGMSTARAAIHLGRAYKNTKYRYVHLLCGQQMYVSVSERRDSLRKYINGGRVCGVYTDKDTISDANAARACCHQHVVARSIFIGIVLNQLSNRENLNANIQNQISRNLDANTHALHHLQTSFNNNASAANATGGLYTELDCVWLLYCKNLVATAKLSPPYGTMARINGLALRMLTGELSADKALDTMLYEVLTGWTELRCTDMFPRCSKVNAASIVMESILQPLKTSSNRKSQSTNRSR